MNRRLLKITAFVSLSVAVLMGFQNCTQTHFSPNESEASKFLRPGNGGPYGGKPGTFRAFDDKAPCSELDRTGKALPNTVVLIRANDQGVLAPFLARQSCQDIAPMELAANEIQMDPSGESFVYHNQVFSVKSRPGDFDLVAASCPAGKTEIPNALRQNAFSSTYDWTYLASFSSGAWSPGWYSHEGIQVGLNSTIASLPAFLLQRTDPKLLDEWRRTSQNLFLKANTEYSFTFLAQPGSTAAADFTFYRGWTGVAGDLRNEEVVLTFDFATQSVKTVRNTNVSNVRAVITPFGNGFLCTVYWMTSPTADQTESSIGVAPSARSQANGQVGDSIIATAAQLVPVNEFCR